jgi:hypothetical protein
MSSNLERSFQTNTLKNDTNNHDKNRLFFSSSSLSLVNSNSDVSTASAPIYDAELVVKWRQSYLILVEILISYGARIDMPAGSYRNSLDGLLSTLIELAKRFAYVDIMFDIKYLKRLISILMSSFNLTKNRSIYFKHNLERFIQLICSIHIHTDNLADILVIVHHLLRNECQPLKLNTNTLMHLFKVWLTNPNFLCSSLISKDLFMRQILTIIVRRLSSLSQTLNTTTDTSLLLSTTSNLPRKSSLTLNDNEIGLQNLFLILLNLISYSQTCAQIHSIYELILIFVNHTSIDIINQEHLQPPIIYLCSQVKLSHPKLLFPFIDLFTMIHTSTMIDKTKDILSQISTKRLSIELYKYFHSNERTKMPVRSLRHISTKYLYHHLLKPFVDSISGLSIGDALKERLIHFHDV